MKIIYSERFETALIQWKKRDPGVFERIKNQIEKVIEQPTLGKPLRYALKNRRRVRVGSFVLVYEFHSDELRFLDFDRHDKIYKKDT